MHEVDEAGKLPFEPKTVNRSVDIAGFLPEPRLVVFCLALFGLSGLGIAYNVRLWTCVDAAGLSCVSHKTPYWDFLNLWQGGRLALAGSLDVLFEPDQWRQLLRDTYSQALPDSEWSYPPTMLLSGAVLSLFAALVGLRVIPVWMCALVCLTPLVLQNALFGQNGAYTTALLIGALAMAPLRLAGAVSLQATHPASRIVRAKVRVVMSVS